MPASRAAAAADVYGGARDRTGSQAVRSIEGRRSEAGAKLAVGLVRRGPISPVLSASCQPRARGPRRRVARGRRPVAAHQRARGSARPFDPSPRSGERWGNTSAARLRPDPTLLVNPGTPDGSRSWLVVRSTAQIAALGASHCAPERRSWQMLSPCHASRHGRPRNVSGRSRRSPKELHEAAPRRVLTTLREGVGTRRGAGDRRLPGPRPALFRLIPRAQA